MSDPEMVHVRLPVELVKEFDHLAVDWRVFRGPAMERVLRLGLAALEAEFRPPPGWMKEVEK